VTAERVILLRHGQTDWNIQGRIQGARDFPLNKTGRAQARAAAPAIAALGPRKIVSSPLSRARDTAHEIAILLGLPVELDQRLEERNYGDWEGLNREQLIALNPTQYAVWRDGGQPEGLGIEHNDAVGERVALAVNDHAGAADGGTILFVAHGAAIRAGVTTLLGMNAGSWAGLRGLDNCHWAILTPQRNRTPHWRLVAYNLSV
jgi:broad specificity phosphatase PhoE